MWSTKGVYLRGIQVDLNDVGGGTGVTAWAICVSTHLTMFTVTDETGPAEAIEDKVRVTRNNLAFSPPCFVALVSFPASLQHSHSSKHIRATHRCSRSRVALILWAAWSC
jgi:hypothetical protein